MNNPEEIKTQETKKEVNPIPKEKESKEQKVSIQETKEKKHHTTTILEEKSINLIPVMSREQIKQEDRKNKMNKTSLLSLLFLLAISIVVVGFSIISQIQLNFQKEKLFEYEEELSKYNQLIIDNNQIQTRLFLYQDIQRGRYSTTQVVDHIQSILSKTAGSSISTFGFSSGSHINFRGESGNLEELSKLWYLLVNDPKLERVVLKSLSRGVDSVSFMFEANIILDEFILLTEN